MILKRDVPCVGPVFNLLVGVHVVSRLPGVDKTHQGVDLAGDSPTGPELNIQAFNPSQVNGRKFRINRSSQALSKVCANGLLQCDYCRS